MLKRYEFGPRLQA
jgi:hypothetical protein